MRKGFIYNQNNCVNCGACSAACILENGWTIRPRSVITFNSDVNLSLPVINLSLACNHCETAACLEGCPTSAFSRDSTTGSIILNEEKCIGCKYCLWNCPYDAPKYDREKRVIGKCNLCYTGLIEGKMPACSTGCPTGALNFGEIPDQYEKVSLSWFPDKDMNPSISFVGSHTSTPVRIIPDKIFDQDYNKSIQKKLNIDGEWSLVIFSFLTTISVAIVLSSLIKGNFPDKFLFLSILLFAFVFSLFHLGKKIRAWRSLTNIRKSPLSREIAMLLIFSGLSVSALFSEQPDLLIASSIAGLILLILVDAVYINADKRMFLFLHNGQTFLSVLIIGSYLAGSVIPFIFISIFKVISSVYSLSLQKDDTVSFVIRFFRLAILLVTMASISLKIFYFDPVMLTIFLSGELLDRIFFYIDFSPISINKSITIELKAVINEKKRS
jgi:Fe-S-cluster-containing dehydrogenase component